MSREPVWLRGELVGSRLAEGEPLPEAIRWIDLDEAMRAEGGSLQPGRPAIPPRLVGTLGRWRLAGLRPLVATCARPVDVEPEAARIAALEIDILTGGTLDAIRILPPGPMDEAADAGARADAPADRDSAATPRLDRSLFPRIHAALLGLAVGDCLGAPVENWPQEKILRIHGPFRDFVSGRGWGPGHPTRETTLALLWFRELASARTVHRPDDRDRLAQALGRWALGRPRDFGHLTRGVLRAYLDSPPVPASRTIWEKAGRKPEFNGALSRAAAIGAALPHDPDRRCASAIAASGMTHPAPVALACAVALADGVAAALASQDPLEAALAGAWHDATAAALEEVRSGWQPGGSDWNSHERSHPLKTIQAAFWACRREAGFEEALLDLIHRGGDADTHGAAAGALLGALHGADAIPERWRSALRVRELIEHLVSRYRGALE